MAYPARKFRDFNSKKHWIDLRKLSGIFILLVTIAAILFVMFTYLAILSEAEKLTVDKGPIFTTKMKSSWSVNPSQNLENSFGQEDDSSTPTRKKREYSDQGDTIRKLEANERIVDLHEKHDREPLTQKDSRQLVETVEPTVKVDDQKDESGVKELGNEVGKTVNVKTNDESILRDGLKATKSPSRKTSNEFDTIQGAHDYGAKSATQKPIKDVGNKVILQAKKIDEAANGVQRNELHNMLIQNKASFSNKDGSKITESSRSFEKVGKNTKTVGFTQKFDSNTKKSEKRKTIKHDDRVRVQKNRLERKEKISIHIRNSEEIYLLNNLKQNATKSIPAQKSNEYPSAPRAPLLSVGMYPSDPLVMRDYSNSINVVDQHQDALKYWFQDSSLPTSGNVLVHIDGHDDMGLPPYSPGYPWFSRPSNKYELRKMILENNDMLITGAFMTGLISRMIYIYPEWAWDQHDGEVYTDEIWGIGWFNPDKNMYNKTIDFCTCELGSPDYPEDDSEPECWTPDVAPDGEESGRSGSGEEERAGAGVAGENWQEWPRRIHPEECHLQVEFNIKYILDTEAARVLMEEELVTDAESMILDIDEDFFGVEAAEDRFKKVGVYWKTVEMVNSLLDDLFCITSAEAETVADQFLGYTIRVILKNEKSDLVHDAFNKLHKKFGLSMFCQMSDSNMETALDNLILQLALFNKQQLQVFLKIGFCLREIPDNYVEKGGITENDVMNGHPSNTTEEQIFNVCHGSTGPDNNFISHHIPSSEELIEQTDKLKAILGRLPKPKHVTVSRSFRDGYVPKEFWSQIEKNILLSVQDSNPEFKKINYDENLLGGPAGWLARKWNDNF